MMHGQKNIKLHRKEFCVKLVIYPRRYNPRRQILGKLSIGSRVDGSGSGQ